ncbi:MAG TPA: NAD(P)/FAD-dependent oxidoreductase, partial [Cyclobacteriaceae bacterium]|nr:NAD(P)/FAD-dependent oxidoreductase [Cyclobacteriaceae bacterium]
MTHASKHIAIVGSGLVGTLASIYLRKRGYTVSVFERRPDPRQHSLEDGRSINMALSNRGIKALDEVGMAERVKQIAVPMHGRAIHDVNGNIKFQPYGKEGEFINSISRGGLTQILIKKAEEAGVEFFFSHRCTHIDLETSTLTFQGNNNSLTKTFDNLLGADGSFSSVRGAMQITERFDYSQSYIEHGYKELHIPAGKNNAFLLEKGALHIWPRESYMLIALPNADGTFTCTLFFPLEGEVSFHALKSDAQIKDFFQATFPDVVALMPELLDNFKSNPTSSLVTIKCFPWVKNKTLLIGDAAHGIVPFFGQGMNAGFEDCRILNQLLDKHHDDWQKASEEFQQLRKPDTDAIAQLALENFIEMRDLVADEDFLLRKKIEAKLHELYPEKWIPLYSMVTFHEGKRYSESLTIGR